MKFRYLILIQTIFLLIIGLIACGDSNKASSGNQANRTTIGIITGFGSIFVSGTEFETDNSTITIDGKAADESQLQVGMVATVTGDSNGTNGTATSISISDEAEGIVISTNLSMGSGTLNVMGHSVNINTDTLFESDVASVTSIDQIMPGHIVEVSGFSNGSDQVFASRLELKALDLASYLINHTEGVEVKGMIAGLNSNMRTLMIGDMEVDYSEAVIDDNVMLANDLYVEVKSTTGLNQGILIASKIELENDGKFGHHGDDEDEFEVKGVITSDYNGVSFGINGVTVIVHDNTELKGFTDPNSLFAGTRIEIEGMFNQDGDVMAQKIELERQVTQEFETFVSAIMISDTNSGRITLDTGETIIITNETLMVDERDQGNFVPVSMFNLTELEVGDFVKVGVFVNGINNDMYAVKLKRDDSGNL